MKTLLSVDIGTTFIKAGLFTQEGQVLNIASQPTPARKDPMSFAYYQPDDLWHTTAEVISAALSQAGGAEIAGVGIASMAETGTFFDRRSGEPKSVFIPWFDMSAAPQAARLAAQADPVDRFMRTGIYPSFKCSLAKILWFMEQRPDIADGAVWLSVADSMAYRLTGEMGTDPSLASRTYAFDMNRREWDDRWLDLFGLSPDHFPTVRAGRHPVGTVTTAAARMTGLPEGIPVCIAGHDHVCAGLAMGAIVPGVVFDSMGTAETMLGALPDDRLDERHFRSGLSFGCHVVEGMKYWLGGLSYSGGSVEWLRGLLGEAPLSYKDLERLLDGAPETPTGILYFPYLAGSQGPHADPLLRGAFIGMSAGHGRPELAKAVLEGTSFEMESIRQAAVNVTGFPIERIIAAGGGTRNRHWMRVKTDVSGIRFDIPAVPEATLLGAALLAGVGAELFPDEVSAQSVLKMDAAFTFLPDPQRHETYRRLYQNGYLALQAPLSNYYHRSASEESQIP